MGTKQKNPKKVKVVNILVKYSLNKIDFEVFGNINDAEMRKDEAELNGFICHICRKQIK